MCWRFRPGVGGAIEGLGVGLGPGVYADALPGM